MLASRKYDTERFSPMSTKKSIQLFTLLAASLLATACGSKSESVQSSVATSSSRVTASSSSKKLESSTSASSKATAPNGSTKTEQASSSAAQGASSSSSAIAQDKPKTESNQAVQTPVSQLNPEAIAKGDFSTLAGTWTNGRGESVTFDSKGFVSYAGQGGQVDPELVMSSPLVLDTSTTILSAGLHHKKHGFGMALLVFPAGSVIQGVHADGTRFDSGMTPDARDHIQIGQSMEMSSDGRFYKN